jgi:histidinol-phosphate aminotransferase
MDLRIWRYLLVTAVASLKIINGVTMNRFWSDITRQVQPYIPGEQPKDRRYIKLNTNENPYAPSLQVLAAIRQAADDSLRLYPDPACDEVREVIARQFSLTKEQVFMGNGSDEILAFSFMAFFNPGNPILFPDITYSFYKVYAAVYNIPYELLPLNDDFSLSIDGFSTPNGGIVIANPNAPTGRALPLTAIESIIQRNSGQVVIVDEAYVDFGAESAVPLIKKYPNLLVVHTFSKSRALAGLRVGFAMGDAGLIEGLCRIKESINSYTLDRLALKGAVAALQDTAYFELTRNKIIATRERISQALAVKGFSVIPSKTNFLFISHPQVPAAELFSRLREKGILVRYFKAPRIDNYLRVTIGTDAEMDAFLSVL